jgi:hypothetical protein
MICPLTHELDVVLSKKFDEQFVHILEDWLHEAQFESSQFDSRINSPDFNLMLTELTLMVKGMEEKVCCVLNPEGLAL